ncbi:hypothetical protein [Pseudanabaena sp. Chao 1811]|uniref:hypothetical protein n=1 Tax=Pseudanabaena sp. Chao 1811 TaxID=2963092 RepID=UPI0022F3F85F|nr:hypothetical protein [Pseudanabaena sp. Chao 1811]
MKKFSLYNLAIAASISVAAVSCTPTTTTTSTTTSPSASATPSSASAKPSASPSASPSSTASASPTASPSASASPKDADSKTEKAPDTVRIAVVNNSGKVLKAIYMSAPSKQDWGPNELDAPLADREKADFEWKRSDFKGADAGCVFDVRAEYDDGKSAELDPIDVCKTPAINLK